jgi:hypothetical protein
MRLYKIIVITAGLLFLLLAGSLPAQTEPVFKPHVAKKLPWKGLSFAAKKVLGEVTTEIQWEELTAEEIKDLLIPVPMEGALPSTGGRIFRLEGRSVVKPLWGSDDVLRTQAWYDSGSGAALQRIRWRRGKERWEKIYRFTARGVYRLRRQPANSDEVKQPPADWTDTLGSFYAYGAGVDNCSQILEPLVLLYLASAADWLKAGSPVRVCVFGKKQLHQVQVYREGIKKVQVDYVTRTADTIIPRKEKIEAVRLACRTRSLAASGEQAEPFSFLGLKGDFDIDIDRNTRIPVQVSGEVRGLGQLDIKLQDVVLRQGK